MEYFSSSSSPSSSSSSSFYKALAKTPICDTTDAAADPAAAAAEKERMFEKVVTPSDVGKLNRLVIPKQHAEKYFPLDSAAGEKGLLLNFEECRSSGKSWRFRYSYWSSSQSYVITKGWSRFVKDKKLNAGDVVSFSRTFSDGSATARLFIDWCRRRRPDQSLPRTIPWCYNYNYNYPQSNYLPSPPLLMGVTPFPPPIHHRRDLFGANYGVISQNSCLHHGSVVSFEARATPMLSESVPVVNEKVAPKRLRLFGVNMECTQEEEEEDCSLQLRLQGGDPSSGAGSATSAMNIDRVPGNFLSKGKSSMSLDFGV